MSSQCCSNVSSTHSCQPDCTNIMIREYRLDENCGLSSRIHPRCIDLTNHKATVKHHGANPYTRSWLPLLQHIHSFSCTFGQAQTDQREPAQCPFRKKSLQEHSCTTVVGCITKVRPEPQLRRSRLSHTLLGYYAEIATDEPRSWSVLYPGGIRATEICSISCRQTFMGRKHRNPLEGADVEA
jgi:hypothetical protein